MIAALHWTGSRSHHAGRFVERLVSARPTGPCMTHRRDQTHHYLTSVPAIEADYSGIADLAAPVLSGALPSARASSDPRDYDVIEGGASFTTSESRKPAITRVPDGDIRLEGVAPTRPGRR